MWRGALTVRQCLFPKAQYEIATRVYPTRPSPRLPRSCRLTVTVTVIVAIPLLCAAVTRRYKSVSRPNFDLCAACRHGGGAMAEAAAPYIEMGAAPPNHSNHQPTSGVTGHSGRGPAAGGGRGGRVGGGRGRGGRAAGSSGADELQNQHLHQPLVDWVWSYFTGQHAPSACMAPLAQRGQQGGQGVQQQQQQLGYGGLRGGAGGGPAGLGLRPSAVTVTGLPPLYFQVGRGSEGKGRELGASTEQRPGRGRKKDVSGQGCLCHLGRRHGYVAQGAAGTA